MSGHLKPPSRESSATVKELRERLGLFSFQHEERRDEHLVRKGSMPELDLRPGVIVEWLVARPGAGALTSTLRILSQCLDGRGTWVIVDPVRECVRPRSLGMGHQSEPNAAGSASNPPGNLLGDRAVPAMSRSIGHVGVHRSEASDDCSSPLENGGGSRRRCWLAVSSG